MGTFYENLRNNYVNNGNSLENLIIPEQEEIKMEENRVITSIPNYDEIKETYYKELIANRENNKSSNNVNNNIESILPGIRGALVGNIIQNVDSKNALIMMMATINACNNLKTYDASVKSEWNYHRDDKRLFKTYFDAYKKEYGITSDTKYSDNELFALIIPCAFYTTDQAIAQSFCEDALNSWLGDSVSKYNVGAIKTAINKYNRFICDFRMAKEDEIIPEIDGVTIFKEEYAHGRIINKNCSFIEAIYSEAVENSLVSGYASVNFNEARLFDASNYIFPMVCAVYDLVHHFDDEIVTKYFNRLDYDQKDIVTNSANALKLNIKF